MREMEAAEAAGVAESIVGEELIDTAEVVLLQEVDEAEAEAEAAEEIIGIAESGVLESDQVVGCKAHDEGQKEFGSEDIGLDSELEATYFVADEKAEEEEEH